MCYIKKLYKEIQVIKIFAHKRFVSTFSVSISIKKYC